MSSLCHCKFAALFCIERSSFPYKRSNRGLTTTRHYPSKQAKKQQLFAFTLCAFAQHSRGAKWKIEKKRICWRNLGMIFVKAFGDHRLTTCFVEQNTPVTPDKRNNRSNRLQVHHQFWFVNCAPLEPRAK